MNPHCHRYAAIACVTAGALCAATGQTLAQATFTGLGTMPGHTHSYGNAVSADGSTVVGYSAGIGISAFR